MVYSAALSGISKSYVHYPFSNTTSNIRRNRLLLTRCIIISCIFMALFCITSILIVQASDHTQDLSQNKFFTSITVHEDDTLWDLADRYNPGDITRTEFIRTIKQLNNMTSDTLYSGQQLLIYYYSDTLK